MVGRGHGWGAGGRNWGLNQGSYGFYLNVSKSGGMGWSRRGKGRGNQRGSGGREGGEARTGAMLSHRPQGQSRPFGGHGAGWGRLREPQGGLGALQAGVRRRSGRPEEYSQTDRQTVQSPIK